MTETSAGPHRIDVHAHCLVPAYKGALQEAEMWLIGGIPPRMYAPEGDPQPALGEAFSGEELRAVERAGALDHSSISPAASG